MLSEWKQNTKNKGLSVYEIGMNENISSSFMATVTKTCLKTKLIWSTNSKLVQQNDNFTGKYQDMSQNGWFTGLSVAAERW